MTIVAVVILIVLRGLDLREIDGKSQGFSIIWMVPVMAFAGSPQTSYLSVEQWY